MRVIIFILIATLSFSSCVNEQFEGSVENIEKNIDVRLKIQTKDIGESEKSAINQVRIIVFDQNGVLTFNKVVTPTLTSVNENEYKLEVSAGNNQFYVICNETTSLTNQLTAVRQVQDIEPIMFDYSSPVTFPFVMFGKVTGNVKTENGITTVDFTNVQGVAVVNANKLIVGVKRIAAKVSLTFIKTMATGTDFEIGNIRAKVCQMPQSAYIAEARTYIGSAWLPEHSFVHAPTSGDKLVQNGAGIFNSATNEFDITGDYVEMEDVYIPEYYLATTNDRSQCTYIWVTADAKRGTENYVVNWRIDLENNGSYTVERNSHYKILASISGLGAMNLYADIRMATVYDVEVGWKPIEGLTIVSDRVSDFSPNLDAWNDYNIYSGVLKVYANNTYSDVLFKYGSVVGLGAANASFNATSDLLWSPANLTTSINSWPDVPFLSSGDVLHNATTVAAGKGDPCKLVRLSSAQIAAGIVDNGQWHMATEEEMNTLLLANDNQNPNFVSDNRGYNAHHSLLIPATHSRDEQGALINKTDWGGYWTSQGGKAFVFQGIPNTATIETQTKLNRALTVRCVRNTIPASTLSAGTGLSFAYQGNTTTGSGLSINTNLPYWTARLITDGPDVGTAPPSEFADFSFEPFTPGSGTNVHLISGKQSQILRAYVARKNSTTSRSFKIAIRGIGYDGQEKEHFITVTQYGYQWGTHINPLSPDVLEANERIPQAGGTYTITVNITPADIELPVGAEIWAYVNSQGINYPATPRQPIVSGVYTYTFSLTVPPNMLPDVRPVGLVVLSTLPNNSGGSSILYYQKNN